MSKRIAVLVVVGALFALPAMGYAAEGMSGAKWTLSLTKDYTASPWTSEVGWSNRAGGKFVFGLKNALLGWADLFTEPKEAIDGGGNFFVGLGYGVKDAVENTLGGVVHVVTFPLTELDAPLPEGGTQLL
ncbi:MAG: hypothetical protein HYY91_03320 [Candidatus Omnitrophica bacterium]|nr:hypothetical protein [Candidatus Omnitrophota bacterium]